MKVFTNWLFDISGLLGAFFEYHVIVFCIYHLFAFSIRCRKHQRGNQVVQLLKKELLLMFVDIGLYVILTGLWTFASLLWNVTVLKDQIIGIQLVYINAIILVVEIVILTVDLMRNHRQHERLPS